MRRLAILLGFLPVLATTAASAPANISPTIVPPRAKGSSQSCPLTYPTAALRERRQGTTELLFAITESGTVAGVVIAASSGASDLDFTSAACATKWLYDPATVNGAPARVSWEAQVKWSLGSSRPKSNTPKIRVPATNCILTRPASAAYAKAAGSTSVRYQLLDGVVSGALVERSSGNAALDEHAARCVRTWRFEPVMESGAPATGPQVAIFDWLQKPPPEPE
jgi:TonB family protein